MAELEGKALLLGIWRNVEDLEESLNLPELNLILNAAHDQRRSDQRFYALFKGVDLDKEDSQSAQDAFDRVNTRAQARLRGISEEEVEKLSDAEMFGLEFEVEE